MFTLHLSLMLSPPRCDCGLLALNQGCVVALLQGISAHRLWTSALVGGAGAESLGAVLVHLSHLEPVAQVKTHRPVVARIQACASAELGQQNNQADVSDAPALVLDTTHY